jgi:hypothetical protein
MAHSLRPDLRHPPHPLPAVAIGIGQDHSGQGATRGLAAGSPQHEPADSGYDRKGATIGMLPANEEEN